MTISREDFNRVRDEFLDQFDDRVNQEWYCTEREMRMSVMGDLERHLFGEEDAREERRAQYLALKAEFEPDQGSPQP